MLRMHLLGGLHLTLNDEPLTGFISTKVQALLCYLVINHRQPHLRSSIAALFWGDMPDEDAATNLRQAIANLKKLLEPYFEINRQTIAFKSEMPYELDVVAFETTHNPNLYRGELLAGFGLADAPDFDDWLATERERLHVLALTILRKQAETQRANNQDTEAIASLQRLISLDPLDEAAHRQLMLMLSFNGQRSAALAQYEICRDLLAQDLDVEPEIETTRLYQRLRSAEKLTALPGETTPFIGRAQELSELMNRMADPTCHLITIVGLGGIGKTRLALRLGYMQTNRMLHGVVMVSLTSVYTLDFFYSALAEGLHFSLSKDGSPRQQLLNYLREKYLLLILDNFEQLVSHAADFLAELMRSAPDVKIVVTSRQRLNLRGEWILVLDGLPITKSDQPAAAQALFWETARRVRGDDLLTNQSEQAITRICSLVGGMPLAIELAAAWSRLLSCEELAEEIASNLTALEATTNDVDARHHSLRAVFDQSWQLFSLQEQQVLMALSAFAAGFTRDAAARVAGASLPMLLSLADKMLIRREASNHFSLHEMMRQYLAEKLAQSDKMESVQAAFINYFVQFVREREPRLKSAAQIETLDDMSRDIENIHVAWQASVATRDIVSLLDLLPGLALYHDCKSSWTLGEYLFEQASPVFDEADVASSGAWISHIALFNSRHDQSDLIKKNALRCLDMLSQHIPKHQPSIARAFVALGYWERLRGDYVAAIQKFQQALDLRMKLHDEWGCAECFLNLGSAYGRQNQDDEAMQMTERGLEISQRLGDLFQLARLQTLYATLLERKQNLDEAENIYRAVLPIYDQLNSIEGRSMSYNGLGNVCYFRADYEGAQLWYQEALTIYRQLGTREWEGGTLNNLGEVARSLGDTRTALAYFRQSQAVFRQLGHLEYVDLLQKEIDTTEQMA